MKRFNQSVYTCGQVEVSRETFGAGIPSAYELLCGKTMEPQSENFKPLEFEGIKTKAIDLID